MKIGILSRMPRCYSTRRLKEAAKAFDHQVQVYDTLKFSMMVEKGDPDLYYRSRRVSHVDAVIPRIGSGITFYGVAVLRQFEQMGVYSANESIAITRSRDKLRAAQILSRHDIGVAPTAFVREKDEILPAIKRIGGVPVIIKLLEGTQGVGVILAETEKMAEAIVQAFQSTKQNVLIQKFVKESEGKDIRAIVVGDTVVAAMERRAKKGEFRSNVHRGGTVYVRQLTPEYERTAIRAAQIMGLRIAGVDMLESSTGPNVLEVNSSPGLEGVETATGIDVAEVIIKDIEKQVLFPDVDIRQRLRLAGGYGIAEFPVHNMPDLEGKSLRETDFAEKNIHVMSIARHNTVIPCPHADDKIHTGDILLCYGALHTLRELIPLNKDRKRKRRKK